MANVCETGVGIAPSDPLIARLMAFCESGALARQHVFPVGDSRFLARIPAFLADVARHYRSFCRQHVHHFHGFHADDEDKSHTIHAQFQVRCSAFSPFSCTTRHRSRDSLGLRASV
jgi:hypothetical protein